jgi:uncharacterized protein (TIGR02118 family)
MIRVSVMYPNTEGGKFDIAYYCDKHIPLVRQKLGAALKDVAVEHGMGGPEPGSPPAFLAMGHLLFESVQAFQTSFAPHAELIMKDIPKYTNIRPVIQISEVKI